MKTSIQYITKKWYPNQLIELDNGDIILTASATGSGTLLFTYGDTPIGTFFYEKNPLDLTTIKGPINEEIIVKFNINETT